MIRLGLTGSIGMGKSATATMFRDEGVPVHDSDAAVHALYAKGGAAVEPVGAAFPGVVKQGAIDRPTLSAQVLGDPAALGRLNAIVHPLVAADRQAFVENVGAVPLVVFDIPLLFETGGESDVDKILVVTAPAEVQRHRVLTRPGMTPERFAAILARQVPDAEKQARADYVIDTGHGFGAARRAVREIVATLRSDA
ncbi:dephospho-CoA kinase [Phenylobacterium immobile]|uniref:dephospho-CoA kinase n=1 Tax=Phenylobacterium immobile TaxID=21 RepID=UPI000AE6B25F|nr:dephospho-CoA kinase [Phenylobacterium immobile]